MPHCVLELIKHISRLAEFVGACSSHGDALELYQWLSIWKSRKVSCGIPYAMLSQQRTRLLSNLCVYSEFRQPYSPEKLSRRQDANTPAWIGDCMGLYISFARLSDGRLVFMSRLAMAFYVNSQTGEERLSYIENAPGCALPSAAYVVRMSLVRAAGCVKVPVKRNGRPEPNEVVGVKADGYIDAQPLF